MNPHLPVTRERREHAQPTVAIPMVAIMRGDLHDTDRTAPMYRIDVPLAPLP